MAESFDSLAGRTVLHTIMQYFTAFCSRQEAASDIISSEFVRPFVPDKPGNFEILAQTVLEKLHPKP